MIRFLRNSEINKTAWNLAVQQAVSPLIYATWQHLEALCGKDWHAVVAGNYEWVLPLPTRKKYKLAEYAYQPFFCQQLGVFGRTTPDTKTVKQMLAAIPKSFVLVDLNWNFASAVKGEEKTNYVLKLNKPYVDIQAEYSKDLRKNIRKAERRGLHLEETPPAEVIRAFQNKWGALNAEIPESDYHKIHHYAQQCIDTRDAISVRVKDVDGSPLAYGLFFIYANRIHYLLGAPTGQGLKLNAVEFMLDRMIYTHAEMPYTLDFEGSMIPSVAKFYQKFGAQKEIYHHKKIWVWERKF